MRLDPVIFRSAAVDKVPGDGQPGNIGSFPADFRTASGWFTMLVHGTAKVLHTYENVGGRADAAELVDAGVINHIPVMKSLRRKGAPTHVLVALPP